MNEEQNIPGKAKEAEQDTSRIFLNDSSLRSEKELENDKVNDDYYEVDNTKKEVISSIGDGEMRDEGTVGEGNLSAENPFSGEGMTDQQDNDLQDSTD